MQFIGKRKKTTKNQKIHHHHHQQQNTPPLTWTKWDINGPAGLPSSAPVLPNKLPPRLTTLGVRSSCFSLAPLAYHHLSLRCCVAPIRLILESSSSSITCYLDGFQPHSFYLLVTVTSPSALIPQPLTPPRLSFRLTRSCLFPQQGTHLSTPLHHEFSLIT